MLRQIRESTLRETLHVRVASNTHSIQASFLASMPLCVMALRKFPPFVGPNDISNAPTDDSYTSTQNNVHDVENKHSANTVEQSASKSHDINKHKKKLN